MAAHRLRPVDPDTKATASRSGKPAMPGRLAAISEGISLHRYNLESLFPADAVALAGAGDFLRCQSFVRSHLQVQGELLLDRFGATGAECAALRFFAVDGQRLTLGVSGGYQFRTAAAGGWLLSPLVDRLDSYWIPQPAMLRQLDATGHILSHRGAAVAGLDISASGQAICLEKPAGHVLDVVVWRIPADETELLRSLQQINTLEGQRYFLWSSHTAYQRPADLYLHLVHGHVYENHEVWPKYWRVCSELDAYALYVTLSGLLRSTAKRLYDLLRVQVVFSVIARQAEDGGWHHGEWTNDMESHYRLHAGGMHMLAAYFEETRDPIVGAALGRAASFAAARTDRLHSGMWYLHDSLEHNTETLTNYPFRYLRSRALGKSESNLLVLNTHLDTNIAMARHRQVTGDGKHSELIASARAATRSVIALRPAEWLYRPLFWAIGLTFLPTERAKALFLPLRAVKRMAWKYLIPLLPRIKAIYPRLVMPGGYVERELTMFAFSMRYQPVNLMDLVRTRRLFGELELDPMLAEISAFTQKCGIKERWKEFKGKEDDAIGFWAESLYHLGLASPDRRYRAWLAEAMIDLEDNGLGLPPSLLGSNAEAVTPDHQCPCPSPLDVRLRVANLSRGDTVELLVINPTDQAIALQWEAAPAVEVAWREGEAATLCALPDFPEIQPRAWIHGIGKRAATAE